jgi:hypothetical protein
MRPQPRHMLATNMRNHSAVPEAVIPMRILLKITLLLLATVARGDERAIAFSDAQVFSIVGSEGKDLSGLAFCRNRLLANSDKIDNEIFAVELHDEIATLVPARALPPMPARTMHYAYPAYITYWYHRWFGGDFLDWEDIQCYGDAIYLASERKNGIAKISNFDTGGNTAEWLPIDWYEALHEAGYLNAYNAYVEGLAVLDAEHLLIALERQPRGLAELRKQRDGSWKITPIALSNDRHLEFRNNSEDIAALTLHDGWLYTLERNASAICRRDLTAFKAQSCFSYRSIEDDPRYRFRDQKFGLGEGLAIDDRFIYVVFDNNNQPREVDALDRRALLLKIKIPAAWL